MIYLNGTTNIYGTVNFGSGSLWTSPPIESTLLTGLNSYYKMDELSGTTISSEIGSIDGTVGGTMATNGTGLIDKCIWTDTEKDGTGIAAQFGNNWSIDTGQAYTFNVWMNLEQDQSFTVFKKGADRPLYLLLYNGSSLYFLGTHTSASYKLNINYNGYVYQSGWRMWTLTVTGDSPMNGGDIQLYIDGTLMTPSVTINGLTTSFSDSTNMYVGDYASGQYNPNGLDEFGVWDKVLTQSEVTELYNSGAGNQYPF